MRPKFLIIFFLMNVLLSGVGVFAQYKISDQSIADDILKVTERLKENYLAEHIEENKIDSLLSALNTDGSWPHIDYTTIVGGSDFPAAQHLKNLKALAIAYAKPDSKYYHNQELKEKILLGYRYYLYKKPKSLNWWYNDIGGPQDYMVGLLLLKNQIQKEELHEYSSYLRDLTDNPSHQGMNRIWVSEITINKGCIEDDYNLINKGFKSIASTLVIADQQGMEGIKIDASFHQHRAQLYSGGYGMRFAEITAALMALSVNTSFNKWFPEEKKELFSSLLLNGHQLFSYRDVVDFGAIGRNISRPDGIQGIDPVTLDKMTILNPGRASAYLNWKSHLEGADFPESYRGNKYFWKSDIMTQHGKDYYLSAKVISTRTNGTEMLNGENLKGYNLPLGATNIMTSGKEYKNIFPIWDWTRVPGTTAVMNQSATTLPWYLFGNNEFAGGVSDGKAGAIAYEHSYNGVQAKKAYFFVDGAMLCLGAGIHAMRTQPVVTSVNQCFAKGQILFGGGGNADVSKLTDSIKSFKGSEMRWVYHDGVAYVFPAGGNITLRNVKQSGSWNAINVGGEKALISKSVFSLWINHGTAPQADSYCYIVCPDSSLSHFKKNSLFRDFTVLRNDNQVQMVKYQQEYFIVFYQRGTVDLEGGLQMTLDGKAMVMLKQQNNGFQLSVSDPTHQQTTLHITINQKINGQGVSYLNNGNTIISFKLPTGDEKGNIKSGFYRKLLDSK